MKELEKFFTIVINNRIFVPSITEDANFYHIEYNSSIFNRLVFAVAKSSHRGTIKMTITNAIYEELKNQKLY